MYYELTDSFDVAANLERTWAFFSDARNLSAITPPQMRFTITTPGEINIQQDTHIEYRIRVNGLPVFWRTRIIDWTPMKQFIDLQLKGPYTLWHHQHVFEPTAAGGVWCRDRVIYKMPGWVVGRAVHATVVKRQLLDIFRFRRDAIARLLGQVSPRQSDVEIRSL